MKNLQARAEQIAEAMERRRTDRLVEALKAQAPRASIEVEQGRIAIGGRNLLRRWLSDPALRFVAELGR